MESTEPGALQGETKQTTGVSSIGPRARALRTARGVGLRELARRVGVTPSLLSQIERGGVNPSVGTLFRLAEELGTTTDSFFRDHRRLGAQAMVVGRDRRARIELSGGIVWERLTPTDEAGFEFMHTLYPPGAVSSAELMRHPGRDYGILVKGVLDITVAFETHRLQPGDSIAFDASLPHRLVNPGPKEAETIWVVLDRNPTTGDGHAPSFEQQPARRGAQ